MDYLHSGNFNLNLIFLKTRVSYFILFLTCITSVVLHWKIFSTDLIGVHLWRQIQNQWNIRNFHRVDNNILNPRIAAHNLGQDGNILRYEFPLMQWSIAQVQRICGESIVVTRMCMFVLGFMGVIGFYQLINLLFRDKTSAAFGAWIFSFSPLFYYYTMNPLSDIPALSTQIWMMVSAVRYLRSQDNRDLGWSALFLCLGGLFKLPYIVFGIIPFTAAILIYRKQKITNLGAQLNLIKAGLLLFGAAIPVAAWYIYVIQSWVSMGVLKGIFGQTDYHEIPRFIQFHLTYWLPRYLINPLALIFLLIGIIRLTVKLRYSEALILLSSGAMGGLAYYIYEVNMISTVHDYYLLPFLVYIHLVAIYGMKWFIDHKFLKYIPVLLMVGMPVIAYWQINDDYWHIDRNGYNPDWFTYKSNLKQALPDDALCIFLNDNTGVVMPYEVDKQGYVFDKDELPPEWIADMVLNRNVQFMYSDSRKVDTSAEVQFYIDRQIAEYGTVKVFQLVKPEKIKAAE